MPTWSNWAGNQRAEPREVLRPRSSEELAEAVRHASGQGRRVKAVGSGHSFTAVGRPDDILVDLGALDALHYCDRELGVVTVGAGVTLRRLNDLLAGVGLALTNLGDIDAQTLAGAVSTGTHGTGEKFQGIAASVIGLELVGADGSLTRCGPDERADLWSAARVGLGALGIITRVTLRCVPLFTLRAEEGPMPLDDLLARFDELAAGFDHFEAYWFPHTRSTSVKRNTRLHLAEGLDRLPAWREWLDDEFLSNRVFGWTVELGRRRPHLIPRLNRVAANALGERSFTDLSYKVFTSPRRVRFKEMELAIPRLAAVSAIREVTAALQKSDLHIGFPVEIRVLAPDDIPLSTASGRESAYLAFHVPAGADHQRYFRLVADVLEPYAPRPHWGKLHELDAAALRGRYPRFDEFVAVRDRVDPTGVFANAYLDRVLGPAPEAAGHRPP